MTDKTAEAQTLEKLQKRSAGEALTVDEVEILRRIVKVYQGLQALGWIGSGVRNVLLVAMTLIGAYAAVTGALVEWIKKVGGAE